MPMQGKLIASVLVPAQTQPQRKQPSEQEEAVFGGFVFGCVVLVVLAAAFSMRRSKEQDSPSNMKPQESMAPYNSNTSDYLVSQNEQFAEAWKQDNLAKIKEHR